MLQHNRHLVARAFSWGRTSKACFHSAKAELITLQAQGGEVKRQIDINIGDPGEAYITFGRDIGFAVRDALARQGAIPLSCDPEKIPIAFFHNATYFGHCAVPYPRIVIDRQLPQQNKADNISPATLWLWGASHSITLDGTGDDAFHKSARESYSRLKGVADLLRDS